MRRYITLILFVSIMSGLATAQRLSIESMHAMSDPMTVDMQRRDFNNEICALVKVQLPVAGVGFEGNVFGDTPFKMMAADSAIVSDSEQKRMFFYVSKKDLDAIDLIEHPMGIHVDNLDDP